MFKMLQNMCEGSMRARTAWSMMPPETLVLMKSCRIETELQYLFETIKLRPAPSPLIEIWRAR